MATGLSETDIRTKYITPAVIKAGWDLHRQIREEFTFTAGRIMVTGDRHQRGERKRVDYLLYYKSDFPIALIEAKDADHSVGDGMQQALSYAESLDIPFVYSSNGHGFLEHDRTATTGSIEREMSMDAFPSPAELWARLKTSRGLNVDTERVITQDYYREMEGKEPRYYQRVAINRTVQAVAEGRNRILLVMATGTGKTFTAFQIVYRLWKSGMKKRILFLADRNVLLNQAKNNDFAPFGNKMTKITNRQVDKSYEVYLSLYQAVTGNEDWKNIYKQFTPGFFDLIVIDECHRGSASEDSAWREILEYFSAATQIGMTATPKETYSVSNIEYFGNPIYIYSLKQGIEDGFLAPYKVIRVYLDKDLGWRPEQGQTDKYGREIEDREYTVVDYDNTIILEQRTALVARRVSNYLKKHNCRFDKSIFFCQNIEHAEMLRSRLVNENSDLVAQYPRYAVRITGDSQTAEADLDDFSNPESSVPCLVTTSQLLTTGVDVKTCKFVVLDKNINSMIEFKQIVGRGTRIEEDYDKFFFTIIDFRNATRHFADPDFDGEPVVVKPLDDEDPDNDEQGDVEGTETTIGDSPTSDTPDVTIPPGPDQPEPRKFYIDDVEVTVACERVQYLDTNGKLVTVSLRDYARDRIRQMYLSLDAFISDWNEQTRKTAITNELQKHGVFLNELADVVGADYDAFDLVCHIAFDRKPLTRRERAQNVIKRDYFGKYSGMARQVLEGLLDKYSEVGIDGLEDLNTLAVKPLVDLGTRVELIASFGGREQFEKALREMEQLLYTA
jgi:type I restriction enzyme, R subunit